MAKLNDEQKIEDTGAAATNRPRDYHPESRIEPIPKPNFPHSEHPRWIGHKFTPAGATLPYPGNCIIAHLDPNSLFHHALQALHRDLQKQDWAHLVAFTPPSSYHMTVYECVTDQIRLRHSYPGDLALDVPKKVCDAHMATRLADFPHRLGPNGIGRVRVVGFDPVTDGISLALQPANDAALRVMRDRLSETLKMRHPGHETYSWHLTLGYFLHHPQPEVKDSIAAFLSKWQRKLPESFDLGNPEFCVYDDMMHFRRVFYLE